MAQGCLDRLRYLKLAEILSKIFYSLPGLWLPLRKGVYLPQLLHHLCQPGVGIVASPNHLLHICVQVPELLPSGALLEPVFRKNFDHSGFFAIGKTNTLWKEEKNYNGLHRDCLTKMLPAVCCSREFCYCREERE